MSLASTEDGSLTQSCLLYQRSDDVGTDYDVGVAKNAAAIATLKEDWLALEAEAEGATFFQSFEWCRNAIEHAQQREQDAEFFVILVYASHKLVGLLPLMTIDKPFRKVLTGIAEPFQQYSEMLVAPGHDPEAMFVLVKELILTSGADYLHLGQVRQTGNLYKAIAGIAPASGEDEGAPYVPLHQWSNYDEYFRTIKPKTRKNMRNARNRLEKNGSLEHRVYFEGKEHDDVISRTFAGRADWLSRMGVASRAFNNVGFEEFLDRLKSGRNSGVKTVAMSLVYRGKPIAEQWGFIFNKRYYAYISTWDKTYEESSPGKLHLGEVLKSCFENDIEVADFMIPVVPYKQTWAPSYVPVRDHVLVITPRGWLYANVWLGWARPLAKKIAYAIPKGLRKKVFELILNKNSTGSA